MSTIHYFNRLIILIYSKLDNQKKFEAWQTVDAIAMLIPRRTVCGMPRKDAAWQWQGRKRANFDLLCGKLEVYREAYHA